jgi:hypothetical protein
MFGRSFAVRDRPSAADAQLSAIDGTIRPSSAVRTRPSATRSPLTWRTPESGFVVGNWPNPILRTAGDDVLARDVSPRHDTISVTTDIKTVVTANVVRAGGCPRMTSIQLLYFLFIGGSSTKLPQIPAGFIWVAFFTILIFIVLSPTMRWPRHAPAK